MKKKCNRLRWDGIHRPWVKILFVMKLTVIFSLLLFSQAFALKSYSQRTLLNLKMENVSIKEVLNAIEDKSEYFFLYNDDLINVNRTVSIDAKNEKIQDLLSRLFADKSISFLVKDRQIVLSPSATFTENSFSLQQQKSVSGKVTDSSGGPLPGVSVVVKGTTTGTITTEDGSYHLANVPDNGTLVFSFVGMKKIEITVNGKGTVNAVLEDETIGIEEVVAIGYGTVKKSDLTGAIGSVKGDMISNRQTTQISQALQGSIAGVTVTRNNNAPGSDATIRIRGITTIGNNDPLVIIDGVPGKGLNDVNPNDVESISVLKDAASASIYGARAAAGVILVTTKHAKLGDLNINYNVEYGFEKPTQIPGIVDVQRYMQIANEASWNDSGNNSNEYPTYSKDVITNYISLNAENPDKYPNTDWVNLILKDNAPRQSHVLSIAASTKNIRTNASIAYDKTDGLFSGKDYQRFTVRFNNDITISKMLSATVNFNGSRTINNNPSIDPIYGMLTSPQIYAAQWSDGRVAEGKSGDNIYGQYKYGGFNKGSNSRIGGKASIDFTPFSGLKLSAVVSPNLEFDKTKKFVTQVPYYSATDPTLFINYLTGTKTTSLNEGRNDNYNVTTQFIANYSKSIGSHHINAMAGYENYYAFYENMSASRDQYLLTGFPYLDLGPLTLRDNTGNAEENAYRSFFGRLMYNYKDKYLLQGNIRYDGSSRFYTDSRWGVFPSFSAGWVVSEESFMKNIPGLSFLKLRASWGTLGNERIGNYPYQANLSFLNSLFYKGSTVVSAQTAAQIQYAIQNITWEKSASYDLGVDANFFNNKLSFTGDYYRKETRDMLLTLQIPEYMGFNNPNQNAGQMHTNGWEATLGWNDKFQDLGYSISLNISDYKSVMGNLKGTQFLGDQIKTEGSEYNEWYGYTSDGIYQTQADVDNSAKTSSNVKAGDIKYKDLSGPNGTPDGIINQYDKVLLGGSLPRYLFGGNIALNYKNFDFSVAFQGVGKQNVIYTPNMVQPFLNSGFWGNVPDIIDGKYWSKYNTDEQNLKAKYPRVSNVGSSNNYAMSDYWLFNGAYLRLKNVTLGYSIPKQFANRYKIQGVRLYISLNDFLTVDKFPKGWDPENTGANYPITSSLIFGASIKF
jgi:TonB-linked SusC/RagA family outer membrane protein